MTIKKAAWWSPFSISSYWLSIHHYTFSFASGFVAQDVDALLKASVQDRSVAIADFNSAAVNTHDCEYIEHAAVGLLVGNTGQYAIINRLGTEHNLVDVAIRAFDNQFKCMCAFW